MLKTYLCKLKAHRHCYSDGQYIKDFTVSKELSRNHICKNIFSSLKKHFVEERRNSGVQYLFEINHRVKLSAKYFLKSR